MKCPSCDDEDFIKCLGTEISPIETNRYGKHLTWIAAREYVCKNKLYYEDDSGEYEICNHHWTEEEYESEYE